MWESKIGDGFIVYILFSLLCVCGPAFHLNWWVLLVLYLESAVNIYYVFVQMSRFSQVYVLDTLSKFGLHQKKIRNCTSLFLWLIIKAKPRTFLMCRGAIVPNESFQLKKVIHFYWNSHHPLTLFQLSTLTNSLYIIHVCIF